MKTLAESNVDNSKCIICTIPLCKSENLFCPYCVHRNKSLESYRFNSKLLKKDGTRSFFRDIADGPWEWQKIRMKILTQFEFYRLIEGDSFFAIQKRFFFFWWKTILIKYFSERR